MFRRARTRAVAAVLISTSALVGTASLTSAAAATGAATGAAAAACDTTWHGTSDGLWQTASRWSTGHVPTAAERVCLPSGAMVDLTAPSRAAGVWVASTARLRLLSGAQNAALTLGGVLHVASGGSLVLVNDGRSGASTRVLGTGGGGAVVVERGGRLETSGRNAAAFLVPVDVAGTASLFASWTRLTEVRALQGGLLQGRFHQANHIDRLLLRGGIAQRVTVEDRLDLTGGGNVDVLLADGSSVLEGPVTGNLRTAGTVTLEGDIPPFQAVVVTPTSGLAGTLALTGRTVVRGELQLRATPSRASRVTAAAAGAALDVAGTLWVGGAASRVAVPLRTLAGSFLHVHSALQLDQSATLEGFARFGFATVTAPQGITLAGPVRLQVDGTTGSSSRFVGPVTLAGASATVVATANGLDPVALTLADDSTGELSALQRTAESAYVESASGQGGPWTMTVRQAGEAMTGLPGTVPAGERIDALPVATFVGDPSLPWTATVRYEHNGVWRAKAGTVSWTGSTATVLLSGVTWPDARSVGLKTTVQTDLRYALSATSTLVVTPASPAAVAPQSAASEPTAPAPAAIAPAATTKAPAAATKAPADPVAAESPSRASGSRGDSAERAELDQPRKLWNGATQLFEGAHGDHTP